MKRLWMGLGLAMLALFSVTCKQRQSEDLAESTRASGAPITLGVLKLMPESAVSVIAIPSIESAYEQIETLLIRGAPDDINMEAELKFVVSQFARSAEVYDASTLDDIALAKGIDPQEPIGLYLGTAPDDQQPQPTQNEVLRMIGFDTIPPYAAAFPISNRQDAEQFVADWGGAGTMESLDLDMPRTTIFTRPDKSFSYFFTDKHLVAGSSPDLVRGVADRMKSPATLQYGTTECPADSAYELVQLVRTDKLSNGSGAAFPGMLGAMLPRSARDATEEAWAGWLADYTGADPMVVTWNLEEDRSTVRARLDYDMHAAAKQRLGEAKPLTHVNLLPSDTLGVYSIEVTPRMREGLKELTAEFVGSGGGLVEQINEAFGQLIDTAGGEATVAIFDGEDAYSNVVMLVEFRDGAVTRAKMKELGLAPLVAETYNNVDIYSLIIPAPVPVYYALPKNTLVAASGIDKVKSLIDAVNSGKPTPFAAGLNPPLDPKVPRRQLLVARGELLTGVLIPVLTESSQLDEARTATATLSIQKIRDVRLTTEITNNWQDTRLVVQLD